MDSPRLLRSRQSCPRRPGRSRSRIRDEGAAALDQAQRRADAARYQEITCRSALNPVKGMPFNWTLNPYRGCTHALPLLFRAPLPDAVRARARRRVLVADFRQDELRRGAAARARQAVVDARAGGASARRPIRISRSKATTSSRDARSRRCIAARTPVGLVTKGPMVVRDADLLAELGDARGCTVYMSVPTVDEDAWAALEPGTAHPLQRLRAVRAAARRRRQRRRADGAGRPGLHDRSRRSSRRRSRRSPITARPSSARNMHVPEGRHAGSLLGFLAQRVSAHGRRDTSGSTPAPTRRRTYANDRARTRRQRCASDTRHGTRGADGCQTSARTRDGRRPNRASFDW